MWLWGNWSVGNGLAYLNIRNAPTTNSDVIGKLLDADSICITGEIVEWEDNEKGDWQEVVLDGELAYVYNEWLRHEEPTEYTPIVVATPMPTVVPTTSEAPVTPDVQVEIPEEPTVTVVDRSWEVRQWSEKAHRSRNEIDHRRQLGHGTSSQRAELAQAVSALHGLCEEGVGAACMSLNTLCGKEVKFACRS